MQKIAAGFARGEILGQRADRRRRDRRHLLGPLRREALALEVCPQFVEAEHPLRDEGLVVQLSLDDVREHPVDERHVGVRPDGEVLIRERTGRRHAADRRRRACAFVCSRARSRYSNVTGCVSA